MPVCVTLGNWNMFIQGADPRASETVMNDPHVESLTYRVVKPDYVTYNNPPPVDGELPAFRYRLENGVLTAEMKDHHATVETARECVEEFLRAWELDAALSADKNEFSFAFQKLNVIDRNPSAPGATRGKSAAVMDLFLMADKVTVEKVKSAYPTPPAGLKPSLDTETMWHHYSRYLKAARSSRRWDSTASACSSGGSEARRQGRTSLSSTASIWTCSRRSGR
jgi:hypothetical protein